jgi:hypothetical protein
MPKAVRCFPGHMGMGLQVHNGRTTSFLCVQATCLFFQVLPDTCPCRCKAMSSCNSGHVLQWNSLPETIQHDASSCLSCFAWWMLDDCLNPDSPLCWMSACCLQVPLVLLPGALLRSSPPPLLTATCLPRATTRCACWWGPSTR